MIYYSLEKLYHFLCSKCNKWWSIGDWLGNPLTCPHCGYHSDEFVEKNGIDQKCEKE